jgi:hypothetical protein
MRRTFLLASLVVALALLFTAQPVAAQDTGETQPMTQPVTATLEIPFLDQWLSSGHADTTALAFNDWNEEDPPEVPATCAKCHSQAGYLDYVGADGSEVNVVNNPAPIGSVVTCVTCHNDATVVKTSVIMPSGLELTGLGDESRCMECHQGRESKVSVDAAIADAGGDLDTPNENLGFRNIHYYAAAATKYGTLAKGGYEYDGMTYDAKFAHVEGYTTCIDCHNSHTLEVKVEECATCHTDAATADDLKNVRMAGSARDYDGDGDVEEGIYYELEGLQEALLANIQTYATDVAGAAIGYNAESYPYFFLDTNADGTVGEDEAVRENAYNAWTPRLLKAAYNYQTSIKDPGAFAHGGKYIIELLYDSTADLNSALAEPVDMSAMRRIDAGHFAGSEEAFRHWDAEGTVPGSCAKCHTDTGLPMFLAEGATISQPPANGFQCTTCHNDLQEYTRYEVQEVRFPSGAVVDSGDPDTNLCMTCHQGRESTVSVNRLIGDQDADTVSESLRFLNIHYFAAGATRFGTEAKGAYEYEGKEYLGYFDHVNDAEQCKDCHGAHSLEVDIELCADCHDDTDIASSEDLRTIREYEDDWDGDGDVEEGIAGEIETLRETLYTALQTYAADTAGTAIAYDNAHHPYYFQDTNANGQVDADEATGDNAYNTWTPRLLRGAYNYQYVTKDPGAFVHNGQYIIQVLEDSIEDLGGDVSGMTRP